MQQKLGIVFKILNGLVNNMFDEKHYVPILRWKTAEKEALKELAVKDKLMITPLLELIMPARKRLKKGEELKTPQEYKAQSIEKLKVSLPDLPKEILKYWGDAPIFVDLNLLVDRELQKWGYTEIMGKGLIAGSRIIPVLRLKENTDLEGAVIKLVKQYQAGVCLRILRSDLASSSMTASINEFLQKNGLEHEQVDLLIDFELVEGMSLDKYSEIAKSIQNIPDLPKWRTFTVAGGAFPFDLSRLSPHGTYRITRSDWAYWFSEIYSGMQKRKPAFADYTIQHPIYTEPNPEANPSASIRYTGESEWVIMRGEALHKIDKDGNEGPGHSQYPSHAQLLMSQPEYKGRDFSYGDEYIAEKGQDVDTPNTGSPRTWLRAGVNHHLALVANQISNLP